LNGSDHRATSKQREAVDTATAHPRTIKERYMPSIVTVGNFDSDNAADVSKILQEFDEEIAPEFPQLRRRQIFTYCDLYIHVQDWDVDDASEVHRTLTTDPRCTRLDERLSAYFRGYTAPASWDGPIDHPTASRFYLWPGEHLENLEQTYSAVIVNTQLQEHIPEVSRLFAESDATDFPLKMGTLRRQIFLYRGIYLHMQDFADADSRQVIGAAWKEPDPGFLRLVDDLTKIIPPYNAEGGQLATRLYHWAAS
jgi:hypothetical protein